MYRANENEVAWIAQYRTLGKLVALATAVLFAAYALVDWMVDPALPGQTWPWRLLGALACLSALPFLDQPRLRPWAPVYIAGLGALVAALVSIIFLGLRHDAHVAIIAQMQVLMALAVFGTLRTVIRVALPVMLASVNIGLWWHDAHWQVFALANVLMAGAACLILIISETSYRTFAAKRLLEAELLQQATIVKDSDDAIITTDLQGSITSWNSAATKMLGYTAAEMLGQSTQRLLPIERRADEAAILEHVGKGYSVQHYETTRICKGGAIKHVSASVSPLHNRQGEVIGTSVIARDITEHKRVADALHAKDAMFRIAIETTPDGFWAADTTGQLVDVNQAYCNLSGYSRLELLAMRITDLDASDDHYATAARIAKTMQDGSFSFETLHRRKDGTVWPVEVIATHSPLNGGRLYVFLRDLTERKRAEERSWHQANFDSLTNLPNRSLLFDRLAKECAVARRNDAAVAVLFADLDGFKLVNDRFGHAAGDWVLQEVARRWLACVREVDTVARIGGDEFAIVVGGLEDPRSIAGLAAKLIEALEPEMALPQGSHCRVGVSIGICLYPDDATAIDSLISLADNAMYTSKSRGRNTYTFCGDRDAEVTRS